MRCLICGRFYTDKRTLKTLFTHIEMYKCMSCKKKYKIYPNYTLIPKTNGLIYIVSLFIEKNTINVFAFNAEIKGVMILIFNKMKRKDTFFWIDHVTELTLSYLDVLENDIYILTNHINL